MNYYIGVDGGGTKTEVLVFNLDSGTATISVGGASNPSTVGFDNALETVRKTIEQGIQVAGGTLSDIQAISFCMSGVDRPEQASKIKSLFASKYPSAKLEVVNDGLAALTAGTQGDSGVVVIAGTGSIAVGESYDGKTARAGGYGNLIGDEGGGFYIGRSGLMAAIQYAEGRGPQTRLWDIAAEVFELGQPGEIIPKIYDASHPVGVVASFARYVLEACADDELARRLVKESAIHHLRMIGSVHRQLGDKVSNRVVLAGGLFTNTPVLRDELSRAIELEQKNLSCTPVTHRPSAGAALRALRLVHHQLDGILDAWRKAVTD